jgi:hypothetical protein
MVYDTFTAANTAKGFFSYFDELIYGSDVKDLYLIKGGPGCGKSTFLKKVGESFLAAGYDVERIRCSSDKDSLDGIKILQKGVVIIDATSPHSYDMKYPGANESIIDFSRFWSCDEIAKSRHKIMQLTDSISSRYKTVYNLLKAAASAEAYKGMLIESAINQEHIAKTVKKLYKQFAVLATNDTAKVQNRMLSAFSGSGIYTLSETTEAFCDQYVIFEDQIGIAHLYLSKLATLLTKSGYDTIRVHNPLVPESKLEQIIIPSLKLGFIAGAHPYSPEITEGKIIKKIATKAAIDKSDFALNKNKISFEKKLNNELIKAVCNELCEIKVLHDELEKYYICATDYDSVNSFTLGFINKI